MAKFKVGDVVKPLPNERGYLHLHLIAGKNYTIEGYTSEGDVDVSGEFSNNGDGHGWDEDWFELAESKTTAEALRSSILNIRSKREVLQKELLQLDEQEKESIEKLKERGFILYEENVSKEALVTTNKAVLYAEDIEDDMANPENWKAGDIIIAITQGYNDRKGVLYKITESESANEVHYECLEDGFCRKEFVGKDEMRWFKTNYKFHSRPVK